MIRDDFLVCHIAEVINVIGCVEVPDPSFGILTDVTGDQIIFQYLVLRSRHNDNLTGVV